MNDLDLPRFEGPVLVTGASGFIGSHLRDGLLAAGNDVVALRRPGSPPAPRGRSVEASYDDVASLERAFEEAAPAYVFHVAGVTKGVTYEDFRRGNVIPTANLLLAARRQAPELRRFVHVSSGATYGPTNAGRPLREEDPRRPIERYGQSKLEGDRKVEEWESLPWT
ncbi:MAG: NAD(P)-dependent oxidoreductase, partial [Myxococcota bacterium]